MTNAAQRLQILIRVGAAGAPRLDMVDVRRRDYQPARVAMAAKRLTRQMRVSQLAPLRAVSALLRGSARRFDLFRMRCAQPS